MARYQLHSATIHTTDLNSGNEIKIGGITSGEVSTKTETTNDESGAIHDQIRAVASQLPEFEFKTKSLATWLTYIGVTGYVISSDGSHPGVRLYGSQLTDAKAAPSANAHVRHTIAKGLVVLGELTAKQGEDASLSVMVHGLTDGTNPPLASAYTSITLPTSLSSQIYTLGACKIGNVTMSELSSLSLDFGVKLTDKTPAAGSIWADSLAVRRFQPVLTVTGFDPTLLDDLKIPMDGKQATHAQTIIQFVKRSPYAEFVSAGTSEHVRITMNGIATITQAFSGSGSEESTTVLRVEGVHDGTNVAVTVNPATTYSASP
jgi:hypothetical protein